MTSRPHLYYDRDRKIQRRVCCCKFALQGKVKDMPKSLVTAKDVAKRCNVSQATVSYVINNKEGKNISASKRIEILETARQMGYIPNAAAKSIRENKCMSVGLMGGSNFVNVNFNRTLQGINDGFFQSGYTVTLLGDEYNPDLEECIRLYRSNVIAGVIFVGFDSQPITLGPVIEAGIPFVTVSENGVYTESFPVPHAFSDAVDEAVRFCRDNHLSRIRHFTVQEGSHIAHNVYNLVSDAVKRLYPEADFQRVILHTEAGQPREIHQHLHEYLKAHPFDMAFTPNRKLGVIFNHQYTMQYGCALPPTIKHICFADDSILEWSCPTVSSVSIPLRSIGNFSAQLMQSIIENRAYTPQPFSCSIVHRDSTLL